MLLVSGIRLPITAAEGEAVARGMKLAGVTPTMLESAFIHKISVDARRGRPTFVYTVALQLQDEARYRAEDANKAVQVVNRQPFVLQPGAVPLGGQVIVCGLGPAGLFCALELAAAGYSPIVLERGPAMAGRRAAVLRFEREGVLDPDANIQFGEGGAGTFSDGKLTTRIKDPLCARVTDYLLAAGAPPEIALLAKPHIGTDLLQGVFTRLREELERLGGRVLFDTKLTGLTVKAGRLTGVKTTAGPMEAAALVLAVGNAARDTFTVLQEAGVPLAGKDFSVGYRIEHLQADIDKGLYHEAAGHPALPPGEYALSHRVGGRGVYTFCMCPGGSVVAAASEAGGVVTNGMSLHDRSGPNANAAVVVGVSAARDFGGDPFKAIAFQRELEAAAYKAGGGVYAAPAQRVGAFLGGDGTAPLAEGRVRPSYPRGVKGADLGALLPAELANALRGGLTAFGRKLPGFAVPDALLTGLETRTSSPLRVPRGETLECEGLPGLYPCGEGPGYAGGIMSAATDGLRVAASIITRFKPE